MPSIRQAGQRPARARAAVALARARLHGTGGARAARFFTWLVVLGFGGSAVALRVADGAEARLEGLILGAASWIVWLAAAPLSLAAAEDRRALDRSDGVEALAAARGISPAGLESARVLA